MNRLILLLLLSLLFCSARMLGSAAKLGKEQKDKIESADQREGKLKELDHLVRKVHWGTNLDSALYFAQQQFELALALDATSWQARALQNKGELHYRKGNYETALVFFEQATPLQEKLQKWSSLAGLYRKIGNSLRKMGHVPESLAAYQLGLMAADKKKEDSRSSKAAILNSMGSLYLNQEDFEKAKEYYEESLELHTEIGKKQGIAANINNLSKVYTVLEEYDQAQGFLLRSLALKRADNDLEGIANSNKNLGDIFLKQGTLDSARFYYGIALQWQDSLGLKGDQASSFADLGIVSLAERDWPTAVDWCQGGWEQSSEIGDIKVQVKNGDCLYLALRQLERPEEALAMLESTRELQDSFLSAANTRELTELESSYQRQKAELEAEIRNKEAAEGVGGGYLWLFLLVLIGACLSYVFRRKESKKTLTPTAVQNTPQFPVLPTDLTQQRPPELSQKGTLSGADTAWILQLNAVLKNEIANPNFSVNQMAMALFISRSKLQRRVKKITGLTPVHYFRGLKLQAAMELLLSGEMETIRQVAGAVGFDTPQYFSKLFEQEFGKKPSDWL